MTVLLRDGGAWVERVYQGEQPIQSLLRPALASPWAELWAGIEDEGDPS